MSKIKLFLKFFNPNFRKKVKHVKSVIDCFLNVTLKILVYEIYIYLTLIISCGLWVSEANKGICPLGPENQRFYLSRKPGRGGGLTPKASGAYFLVSIFIWSFI